MSDRLEEIRTKNPLIVGHADSKVLSALFEFHAAAPADTQIALCHDFNAILGGAQNVHITAASPEFFAVKIFSKNNTMAYTAEALEVCANGSMFDSIAQIYGLRSVDFTDEEYEGGIDYAAV